MFFHLSILLSVLLNYYSKRMSFDNDCMKMTSFQCPWVRVSFIYKTKLFFTVTTRVGHFAFEYLWVYCLIPNKIMLGILLLQYYIICKIYYLMEICCSYIFMTNALNLASGSKGKRQKHLLIWSADKIMLIF